MPGGIEMRPAFKRRSRSLPAGFGAPAPVTTAAESTAAALGLRTRLVNGESSPAELIVIERGDGILRIFVRGHLDEREAARLAGGLVAHHIDGVDRPGASEERPEVLFGRLKRQVSDVKFSSHVCFLFLARVAGIPTK
jgi:hypothetical protein